MYRTPLAPVDQASLDESAPLTDSAVDRRADVDQSFVDFQSRFHQLEREHRAQAVATPGRHTILRLEYEALSREVGQTRVFAQLAAERRDRLKVKSDALRVDLSLSQAVCKAFSDELARMKDELARTKDELARAKDELARAKEENAKSEAENVSSEVENARLGADELTSGDAQRKARFEMLQALLTGLGMVLDGRDSAQ